MGAGGGAQVLEHMPKKHEGMSSNLSTDKRKEKKTKQNNTEDLMVLRVG
jgi:hypothetical protein